MCLMLSVTHDDHSNTKFNVIVTMIPSLRPLPWGKKTDDENFYEDDFAGNKSYLDITV